MPLTVSRARHHAALVYVSAFAVATICHVLDLARGRWLPYTHYALGLNGVFMWWTAPKVWAPDIAYPSRDG